MSAEIAVDPEIVRIIEEALRKPVFFRDIVAATRNHRYRSVLQAWSDVRTRLTLDRDEQGRYWTSKSSG